MIGQSRRCMTVSKQDKERQIEIKRRRVKINDSIYKFLNTVFFATMLFSDFLYLFIIMIKCLLLRYFIFYEPKYLSHKIVSNFICPISAR